ncbi:hypothetical protein Drorol1_Dr00000027, partial [Drosera rotundifolia]
MTKWKDYDERVIWLRRVLMRFSSGDWNVVLAGPDGRVIGGGVTGLLRAGSPVQIVVGCFIPDGKKVQRRNKETCTILLLYRLILLPWLLFNELPSITRSFKQFC